MLTDKQILDNFSLYALDVMLDRHGVITPGDRLYLVEEVRSVFGRLKFDEQEIVDSIDYALARRNII